ncbi:9387_t:CDS:1, partial [Diversispora eburnea]
AMKTGVRAVKVVMVKNILFGISKKVEKTMEKKMVLALHGQI